MLAAPGNNVGLLHVQLLSVGGLWLSIQWIWLQKGQVCKGDHKTKNVGVLICDMQGH